MAMTNSPRPDDRFYGRRHGKPIKGSRLRLLEQLLPQVAVRQPAAGEIIDFPALFGFQPRAVWLEVGFGGGEHVAALSQEHPQVGFIASEPFLNGISALLAHLSGTHLKEAKTAALDAGRADNVRLWPDDVRLLFPHFREKSFERIYVLYPDPWPKARHAARRFLNGANIPQLARLLADTGRLYLATDIAAYADWAQEQMEISGLFARENEDRARPWAGWIPTRYEKKGISEGRQPNYLVFCKKIHQDDK